MNTADYLDETIENKTVYSPNMTRAIRNFLIRVKGIMENRNENPNTPRERLRPDYTYNEICAAIDTLSEKRKYGMSLKERENQLLRETIHEADKIFHEVVINMHRYHVDLKNDIDRVNGGNIFNGVSLEFMLRRKLQKSNDVETASRVRSSRQ